MLSSPGLSRASGGGAESGLPHLHLCARDVLRKDIPLTRVQERLRKQLRMNRGEIA